MPRIETNWIPGTDSADPYGLAPTIERVIGEVDTIPPLPTPAETTAADNGSLLVKRAVGGVGVWVPELPGTYGLPSALYLYADASAEPVTAYQMLEDASLAGLEELVFPALEDQDILASWVSEVGVPGVTTIPTGDIYLRVWARVGSVGQQDVQLQWRLYARDEANQNTLLLESALGDVLTEVSARQSIVGTLAVEATIAVTDRLFLEVFATVSGVGGAPTVTIALEDDVPSRLDLLGGGGGGTGGGNVIGPAEAVDGHIVQFDGVTGRVIKDGLAVVTTVGTPGADTAVPTEQAVREAIASLAGEALWEEDTTSPGDIMPTLWPADSGVTQDTAPTARWGSIAVSADGAVRLACTRNDPSATTRGVYVSLAGAAWAKVLDVQGFGVALSSNGAIMAVVYGTSVWISDDTGATWTESTPGETPHLTLLYDVAMSSDGALIIVVDGSGDYQAGIAITDDLGATWSITASATSPYYAVVQSADGVDAVVTGYQPHANSVSSVNSCVTWGSLPIKFAASNLGQNVRALAGSADLTIMVAGGDSSSFPALAYVGVSVDRGLTWADAGLSGTFVGAAASSDGSVLAVVSRDDSGTTPATVGKLYMARDGGPWVQVGAARNYRAVAMTADGSKVYVTVYEGGVYSIVVAEAAVTRDVVPRADMAESLGTAAKQWLSAHVGTVYAGAVLNEAGDPLADVGVLEKQPNGGILVRGSGGDAQGENAVDLQQLRDIDGNVASGTGAFQAGSGNTASGIYSTALGQNNVASGDTAVALGSANTASGDFSRAEGAGSTSAGERSFARGEGAQSGALFSHAMGRHPIIDAAHTGAMLLADSTDADFDSEAADEFAVRASGGVRFVTGGAGLEVDGFPVTRLVGVPASGIASGTPGDVAGDADYAYVCYAADTWIRVAKAAW